MPSTLTRLLSDGYSIILNQAQRVDSDLLRSCRRMEQHLGHPVSVHGFLTPPEGQALAPHFDTHENFIVQVKGTKRWLVFDAAVRHPEDEDKFIVPSASLSKPLLDLELHEGDVLYIPRGFVHSAKCKESLSFHLTFGATVVTWSDLLTQAVRSVARREERLRRAVPPGVLSRPESNGELDAELESLLALVLRDVRPGEATLRAAIELIEQQILPPQVTDERAIEALHLGSKLRPREGSLARVLASEATVTIVFPGGSVQGPEKIRASLEFMNQGKWFEVRQIPGLRDSEKLTLVRRFVREGWLEPE